MVPAERIELPTNGLQNRCSTAELRRQLAALQERSNPYLILKVSETADWLKAYPEKRLRFRLNLLLC